jgi:hypothetical protein
MENETTIPIVAPLRKIYTVNMISVGTLLGGPLVGGYMLVENFKTLNDRSGQRQSILLTVVCLFLAIAFAFALPAKHSPTFFMPFLLSSIYSLFTRKLQGEELKIFIANRGEQYTWWRALLVTGLLLLISYVGLFVFVLILKSFGIRSV